MSAYFSAELRRLIGPHRLGCRAVCKLAQCYPVRIGYCFLFPCGGVLVIPEGCRVALARRAKHREDAEASLARAAAEGLDIRTMAKAREAQDAPRREGFLKTVFRMIWEEIVRSFLNRVVQALLEG